MSWAEEELKGTKLGDLRRTERLVKIVEDLIAQPNESVPQASRDNAAMQGMYEFWSNRRITPLSILSGHSARTVDRCLEHPTVLAIQDTTELDFSSHPKTRGLGPISNPEALGLKVHLTLCSSDAGVPLGILHETVWASYALVKSFVTNLKSPKASSINRFRAFVKSRSGNRLSI